MEEDQSDLLVEIRLGIGLDGNIDQVKAEAVIRAVCEAIATNAELPAAEISISLVGNEEIRELNRQYRGIDGATDVLSFALAEAAFAEAEGVPLVLGDVVISWPKVVEQAQEYGHSASRELAFLTAHGFYHLLGFDHETPEEEAEMFELQEAVLTSLGFLR